MPRCRFRATGMDSSKRLQRATILTMELPPPPTKPDIPPGWRRLWQPRRGIFWMVLAFNALSSVLGGVLRSDVLSPVGMALVGGLALLNALAGMWLMVRMLRGE